MTFLFSNDVVNVIYHVENTVLTRYSGNYEQFQELYEVKKRQLECFMKSNRREIAQLEDFVARNKARAATATLARSRQKRLDKMEIIELTVRSQPTSPLPRPHPQPGGRHGKESGSQLLGETPDLPGKHHRGAQPENCHPRRERAGQNPRF